MASCAEPRGARSASPGAEATRRAAPARRVVAPRAPAHSTRAAPGARRLLRPALERPAHLPRTQLVAATGLEGARHAGATVSVDADRQDPDGRARGQQDPGLAAAAISRRPGPSTARRERLRGAGIPGLTRARSWSEAAVMQ